MFFLFFATVWGSLGINQHRLRYLFAHQGGHWNWSCSHFHWAAELWIWGCPGAGNNFHFCENALLDMAILCLSIVTDITQTDHWWHLNTAWLGKITHLIAQGMQCSWVFQHIFLRTRVPLFVQIALSKSYFFLFVLFGPCCTVTLSHWDVLSICAVFQAVWALGNIAGDNAECRDYVLNCGILPSLQQ